MMDENQKPTTQWTIHPCMGWVSLTLSELDDIIKQDVSQQEIDRFRKQIMDSPLQGLLFNLRTGQHQPLTMGQLLESADHVPSDEEIREAVQEASCQFQVGIVVEIGPMIPGLPEPEWQQGSKVLFHEGKGLDIGNHKLISVESIIGWTDD